MKIRKAVICFSVMSAIAFSHKGFADNMFDQVMNNAVNSQNQQGANHKPAEPAVKVGGGADEVSLSGKNVNPFTGESLTVEDNKNRLSVVTLQSQILDKELEIAKKKGELDILPIRISNQKQIESTSSPVVGQQMLQDQLIQQQQQSQAEIDRKVQDEVRKVAMAKDYEIQTIKKQIKEKRKNDSEMKLSYIGNSDGNMSAVIRVGDKDIRVKEGGDVAGWRISKIDPSKRSVLLTKNGRIVSLGVNRTVSRVSNSSKAPEGVSDYGYQGGVDAPVMPNLPQQLPLPVLR